MGSTPSKQFPPPQAIGAVNRPNDILSQAMAPPPLAQNALQPLIQNQMPFVATANAVPNGIPGSNGGPEQQIPYNANRYNDYQFGGPMPYQA